MIKSILTAAALVLTLGTAASAFEFAKKADFSDKDRAVVALIQPTLDYFEVEVEAARGHTSNVGQDISATSRVGEVEAIEYRGDGVINVRVDDSRLNQYAMDELARVQNSYTGDFIIQLKDVGTQYIVTGYWQAAENW